MELLFKVLLLGFLEGLTEFLPISSTGHLILVGELLHFNEIPGKVFEIVIQLGAILAVCVRYRLRLWGVLCGLLVKQSARRFAGNILLAFLPAMLIGYALHDTIKSLFDSRVVAWSLVVGGVAILLIERLDITVRHYQVESLPPRKALLIGFCQCLAMIPGVSRSGATIMGSVAMGCSRKMAAEFSFFLAIPTMLAATVYDIHKNKDALLSSGHLDMLALGFLVAFFTAILVLKTALRFIERYGFTPFAWYRIALGSIVLWGL
jgi:undecaprenyl-diphosphatase